MSRRQLLVALPPRIRSRVEHEAKRNKQSNSEVVVDALRLYFRLRGIAGETATAPERAAIAEGRRDRARGATVSLKEWRRGVGLRDH